MANSSSSSGQPIIMGVPGPQLTDGLRSLIRKVQPGGFILFARNLESPRQVFDLIHEFNELCQSPPIVTIDQEGGRVSRLKMVGEEPPSGLMLRQANRVDWCREHGELTGRLLALFGFNLNLAPVVDYSLDENADNSLRGRCYGSTPEEVILKAGAFLEGMKSRGVLGTAKHFPGYTHCGLDPHGELPRIDRTRAQIEKDELRSFRAFLSLADCYMIGHGHFPAWHPEPFPASMSREIVSGLLVRELGYKGAIMTDDLEMGAIANRYGSKQATKMAIDAGEHLMLYCHNPACVEIAWDTLCEMEPDRLQPALDAIKRLKGKLLSAPAKFDLAAFDEVNRLTADLRERVKKSLS
ncbi:MAG: glycoside hydrolase family 3 N-terminal domain-containing protein [Methylacidiphilales bacterium]|nr:glycoside hydrolase family 3 N-terminal domain-containing protein [Candidatus Methylacidiphilales bacterium]